MIKCQNEHVCIQDDRCGAATHDDAFGCSLSRYYRPTVSQQWVHIVFVSSVHHAAGAGT